MLLSCCLAVLLTGLSSCADSTSSSDLSGAIHIVGSTALQPLVAAAAPMFEKLHSHVHIKVEGGGSFAGLNAVTSQQSGQSADIGDSDVYADPAIYPDPNLTDHIVCVIPFTMIVNPDVPITSLTRQQIIDIFSTKSITNWAQVGGPDLRIVPVVRPTTSGTRATFRKYILGGRDENGTLLKTDSSTSVRATVAKTPGAISYLAASVLDTSVRAIAIDGSMATVKNIASGHYAFWSYEHMYTIGDGNSVVTAFLNFMLTPPVQHLAIKMGYISVDAIQLPTVQSASGGDLVLSSPLEREDSHSEFL